MRSVQFRAVRRYCKLPPRGDSIERQRHFTHDTGLEPNVVIAVGANLGDRLRTIISAITQLNASHIKVLRHSRLYESAPAYVTDQPPFVNAALAVHTTLAPDELLVKLKSLEAAAGRDFGGLRWGPRPLDLDIIFHGAASVREETLEIPHPRWQERGFVKAPLADLFSAHELPLLTGPLKPHIQQALSLWENDGGEAQLGGSDLRCVLPIRRGRLWPWQGSTSVMGILNVTPDSFSDGGLSTQTVEAAVERAQGMAKEGAQIIDIGGQSTRPGASLVSPAEELSRVMPVISRLRSDEAFQDVLLSIDTFSSEVAMEAAAAGVDIVNDVSGGLMDPQMHATVAGTGLSYILMHMRGSPQTMQLPCNTAYTPGQLALEVGAELQARASEAIQAGIEPWRMILDPGIGFAKTKAGSCELIRELSLTRRPLKACLAKQPLLTGPSRKAFLGWLTGREDAASRDTASAVAAGFCILHGADIIRMHDVAAGRDAVAVSRGIMHARVPHGS